MFIRKANRTWRYDGWMDGRTVVQGLSCATILSKSVFPTLQIKFPCVIWCENIIPYQQVVDIHNSIVLVSHIWTKYERQVSKNSIRSRIHLIPESSTSNSTAIHVHRPTCCRMQRERQVYPGAELPVFQFQEMAVICGFNSNSQHASMHPVHIVAHCMGVAASSI